MKRARILLSLCLAFCLVTCKTKTVYVPVETKVIDSLIIRDTTIDVRLVPYKDSITVKSDSSFLSNPYAYSSARIGTNGLLHHSLGIWPQASLPAKIQFIDRIRYIEIPKPYPVEKPVPVEKKLSWPDQVFLVVGKLALSGIGICILVIMIKRKI